MKGNTTSQKNAGRKDERQKIWFFQASFLKVHLVSGFNLSQSISAF
jgi:hypothetical protein